MMFFPATAAKAWLLKLENIKKYGKLYLPYLLKLLAEALQLGFLGAEAAVEHVPLLHQVCPSLLRLLQLRSQPIPLTCNPSAAQSLLPRNTPPSSSTRVLLAAVNIFIHVNIW